MGILGETGLRMTEGLLLTRDCVDLDRRMLTVKASKNRKTRHIPLTEFAVELFRLVYQIRPDGTHCFLKANCQRWRDPRGPLYAARESLGLDWVGFDAFRHFRATQWTMDGVDVRTVQGLLGHSDIKTTMRYVHYVAEHAQEAVRQAEQRQLERLKGSQQATNRQHERVTLRGVETGDLVSD